MILFRRTGLEISPWRNNAGRKADIASGPGWLIGFAFLDAGAPFSDYTGHERTITLAEGPGFTLSGAGGDDLVVRDVAQPAPFDGGWLVHCAIAGPCIVANAMTERAKWRHVVGIHRGAGLPLLDPAGSEADVLIVLHGTLIIDGISLGRHDAIRLTAPTTAAATDDAVIYRARVLPI